MPGFILFQVLPALAAYGILAPFCQHRHFLLRAALAWILGQFVSTLAVFAIACLAARFTPAPLSLALAIYLFILTVTVPAGTVFLFRRTQAEEKPRERAILSLIGSAVYCCFALAVALALYKPHLAHINNTIFRSFIYWDFSLHFPTIQNFALGANFPPTNEVFAGAPLTNHFFFDLLTACYAVLGGGLVHGLTVVSVLSMFYLILLLGGLSHALSRSLLGGALAAVMFITSSSLGFVLELRSVPLHQLHLWAKAVLANAGDPYTQAFIRHLGYNGNMFNVFYLIVERQLVFACALLLTALFVIAERRRLSGGPAIAAGLLMGLALQWHLFVTVLIAAALAAALILDRERRQTFLLLIGFSAASLPQLAWLQYAAANPEWFVRRLQEFPKLNFSFSHMPYYYSLTPWNAVKYYLFSLGIKPLVVLGGLWTLRRSAPRHLFVLLAVIVIGLTLVNTVQLSPLTIYDNHKWLKPAALVIDLVCGTALVRLLYGPPAVKPLAPILFAALTLSGLMELMPYLNSRPVLAYAEYPSQFTSAIMRHSRPRAVFLAGNPKEILLTGRKLFLTDFDKLHGAQSVLTAALNIEHRKRIAARIYLASSANRFCRYMRRYGIDFTEISSAPRHMRLRRRLRRFPRFTAWKNGNRQLYVSSAGCAPNR